MAETAIEKTAAVLREEEVLQRWQDEKTFEQSLAKDAPNGEFVFYDGPPFATGTPHYGHLLQSAVKDALPRYKTMQGFRVARQWGWDCHGLPIENIVEKEIGSKTKKDIIEMGVKKFNDACRAQIFTYINEWERIIPRFGRWADMAHPYRTMDFEYMQSEWWAFKTLYEKGYVYEGYRPMHICPRCETTLSQGEVAEGYKNIKDLSVTARFRVRAPEKLGLDCAVYFLAWTTTPWTLPGNAALAVGREMEYVAIRQVGVMAGATPDASSASIPSDIYIVNRELFENSGHRVDGLHDQCTTFYFPNPRSGKAYERVASVPVYTGAQLEALELSYEPLFDDYYTTAVKGRENGWRVYAADFVTNDTGTGIVHIAPAFGADDMQLGKEKQLPFLQHVRMDGICGTDVAAVAGFDLKPRAKERPEEIREADLAIVKMLDQQGKVFAYEKYEHSYPHCWRCDTALLNYATGSWFVAVEKIKPLLVETARDIAWAPAHIKEGRFGQWLDGARDWSISRQRFWANTIPVWRCGACAKTHVFGSAAELEAASGVTVHDLHKDVVDEVAYPCVCGASMHRVPDVLDTWFDSGSVPFAVKGYGASDVQNGTLPAPADFIGESHDQCRAWFYYQHVLAGALFGTHAFKHVVVTGMVLAEDGKKMSKKLKNYPDPMEVIAKYGADAMRLYILTSPVVRADNLNFSESAVAELSRKVIGRLVNVYEFYAQYEDAMPHTAHASSDAVLDVWIRAQLQEVHAEITQGYEKYDINAATRPLIDFVDDLSTWYLRRSRERIKDGGYGAQEALATMRFVLKEYAKMCAPSMPFIAEWLWQRVREADDETSVHLTRWSDGGWEKGDVTAIRAAMTQTRAIASAGLEVRAKVNVKVRQPLAALALPRAFEEALTSEHKDIIADEIHVKEVRFVDVFPDGWVTATAKTNASVVPLLALDTTLTEALEREGAFRDVLRAVQELRKTNGLKPGEIVVLYVPIALQETVCGYEEECMRVASVSEVRYVDEASLRIARV